VNQLDGYVWESVRILLQDPKRLVEEWTRRVSEDGICAELRQQRDEAARLLAMQERSLQRLVDAYEAGVLELYDLTTYIGSRCYRIVYGWPVTDSWRICLYRPKLRSPVLYESKQQ
jgi:hypothetical protein